MLEQVDIGHYAKIPIHIARANVSESAKAVWRELAFMSSPEKPQAWIRQESLAEKMGLSTRTIRRLITELEKASLITPNGWHQGRHKNYNLTWTKMSDVGGQNGQECPTSPDENVHLPRTEMSRDGGQKCPHLNRVFKQNTEQNIYFSSFAKASADTEKILADYGEIWKKRFACLDGLSGRPSVEECVEQAMSHESRHKYSNPKTWIEIWLRNASSKWLQNFNRELNAPPTDPSLDKEAIARRCKADNARSKEYYNQPGPLPVFQHDPFPAKLQAEMDEIFARREPGFSEKLLQLMKKHNSSEQEAQSISPGSCQLSA